MGCICGQDWKDKLIGLQNVCEETSWKTKVASSWVVAPCSLVEVCRRFRDAWKTFTLRGTHLTDTIKHY
jgi:hypothetical protein